MFDPQAYAMWESWNNLKGMPRRQAMEIWLEKMTPVLNRHDLGEVLQEDEDKVNANYAACVEKFLAEGNSQEDIEHWSDYYFDYMGGPVQNSNFIHADLEEWEQLMKNAT